MESGMDTDVTTTLDVAHLPQSGQANDADDPADYIYVEIVCVMLYAFFMFFMYFYRYIPPDVATDYGVSQSTIALTKERILEKIRNFRMVVKEENLVDDADLEKGFISFGSTEEEHHFLALPRSKDSRLEARDAQRKIPNCCSICLAGYDPGESVVWSSNPNCPHAFHEDCILSWLLNNNKAMCPYCRQDFIDSDHQDPAVDDEDSSSSPAVSVTVNEESSTQEGEHTESTPDNSRMRVTVSFAVPRSDSTVSASFVLDTFPSRDVDSDADIPRNYDSSSDEPRQRPSPRSYQNSPTIPAYR